MNTSWRMYSWSIVAIVVTVLWLTGCSGEARTGTRNVAEIGKVLAEHIDPDVVAMGKVIELEATAVADNYDAMLFGLWTSRSVASVTADDLRLDLQAGLDANIDQTKKITKETQAKIAIGDGLLWLLGGALGGGAGGAAVYVLRSRSRIAKLMTAVKAVVEFGVDMTKAETDEQAEAVKVKHVLNQTSLGIHDIVKPVLEAAKKPTKVGSHA